VTFINLSTALLLECKLRDHDAGSNPYLVLQNLRMLPVEQGSVDCRGFSNQTLETVFGPYLWLWRLERKLQRIPFGRRLSSRERNLGVGSCAARWCGASSARTRAGHGAPWKDWFLSRTCQSSNWPGLSAFNFAVRSVQLGLLNQ
jgi:hypothetical protein